MSKSDEIAISIKGVSKNFKLPHQKADSIKSLFVNPFALFTKKQDVEVQHALTDISFDINKGEFFGIVGRNGSGKSTLLKILAGIYQSTEGSVSIAGKLVPFIELGVGFNPELTGRENVYLSCALNGFSERETADMYDDIVSFAELEPFMDQKLKNYSSGMQVRLAFSVATRAKADVLLIDEVLAVGDADFQRKCFNYFKELKRNRKTVVFVSHDMEAVKEFCDRAALINNSKVVEISTPDRVSLLYNQLFAIYDGVKDEEVTRAELAVSSQDGRMGTGEVRAQHVKINSDDKTVTVALDLVSDKDTDDVISGIHILDQNDNEVFAVNSKMIHAEHIPGLLKGETKSIQWSFPNILSTGTYTVTLTFVNEKGIALDWLEKAARFKVEKKSDSTTSVLPTITLKYSE